ncbi:hypothetical protein MLD38_037613 [Melastoma candidum]|uniref:Uncharacterized protein n=1 Tax=Melastoma candidum TaxID=119954 RepID=A0ACB9LPE2_9MYRT|nr:hypothetical protein MLD38_037613 [Melastoma candidum]
MILPLIAALGGGIVSRRRTAEEASRSGFKEIWNEWELRGMVFISLSIQVFLIFIGNRRKHSAGPFTTFFTWVAYLTADPVAVYSLGIITSKLTRSSNPRADFTLELNAFWAPFLLLHLGGPDTITAYSLEDNELWLRHFLSLLTQAGVTFYIFLLAWDGSSLSILTIGMIIAGMIKYGERVWVLWGSSSEKFRDSIPNHSSNFSKLAEVQKLRMAEGFQVVPHEVIEVREAAMENNLEGTDFSLDNEKLSNEDMYKRCLGEMLAARGLITIFQRLFADLILSLQDRDMSIAILEGKNFQVVFKIIEIELGIMFDMLYTKAKVIDTWWGTGRRVIVMLFSALVLVVFLLAEVRSNSSSPVDLGMTFLLLGVAIFLEAYALTFLALSDKVACWLVKTKKLKALKVIHWLEPLHKRQRWSGKMAQFRLLSFCLREKHLFCNRLLKIAKLDESITKHLYVTHEEVPDSLKRVIVEHLQWLKSKSTWNTHGSLILEFYNQMENLGWSVELEFDESIVIWHIATELCLNPTDPTSLIPFHLDQHIREKIQLHNETCRLLSRYLVYLLVIHPNMLPVGIGRLKFEEAYTEAMRFFDDQKSIRDKEKTKNGKLKAALKQLCSCMIMKLKSMWGQKRKTDESKVGEACEKLRNNVNTKLNMTIVKEDKSKFVLFHGCLLASQLQQIGDERRWEIIGWLWLEMLTYAAVKCQGKYHCQQLRQGGELLTHVWLLMAHFGMTDHFQIPHAPSITELIFK